MARTRVGPGEFVDAETLEVRAISQRLPGNELFLATKAARRGQRSRVILDYCIDARGRVVDGERVQGDEELAAILLEAVLRWRFEPFRRDGRYVRVCTRQYFQLIFE